MTKPKSIFVQLPLSSSKIWKWAVFFRSFSLGQYFPWPVFIKKQMKQKSENEEIQSMASIFPSWMEPYLPFLLLSESSHTQIFTNSKLSLSLLFPLHRPPLSSPNLQPHPPQTDNPIWRKSQLDNPVQSNHSSNRASDQSFVLWISRCWCSVLWISYF